jgi:hypothetical protein
LENEQHEAEGLSLAVLVRMEAENMLLPQKSVLVAWSSGITLLALLTQVPEPTPVTIKHGPIPRGNSSIDAMLSPAPEFLEDQLAFETAPNRTDISSITAAPKRYGYKVEVWNGSRKNVVSIGQSYSYPSAGTTEQEETTAQLIAPATQEFTASTVSPRYVSHYLRPVSAVKETPTPVLARSASKPDPSWLARQRGVSSRFADEITAALGTIPQPYLNALGSSGYRVVLSQKITDVVPTASHQQVRGYEASTTWNSVYGMFNRTSKRLVMAELADQSKLGRAGLYPLTDRQRRIGIVRHEFGHAMDQYLGNFSHSDSFIKAYERDAATLNYSEKQSLNYFLQSGRAGAEETFAELFACIDGHGCDQQQDQILRDHFGDLITMIQGRVSRVRA